jgi:hypothetical protein
MFAKLAAWRLCFVLRLENLTHNSNWSSVQTERVAVGQQQPTSS